MNRRDFMQSTASVSILSAIPLPALAAAPGPVRTLAWYYAGSDGLVYPYLAESVEDAIRQYAEDHDATYAEYDCKGHCHGETFEGFCPHCGADPDAPASSIEACRPKAWEDIPPEREPSGVDWLNAGCRTLCEECEDDEPTDCIAYKGRALCQECYEMERERDLDVLIGTKLGCCDCWQFRVKT